MRTVSLALVGLLFLMTATTASANDLRWETWEENAPLGGASEGTHAWITRSLYERSRELGMGTWESAGTAMGIMLVWEVVEVSGMDALGVSLQDIAANSAGALSGVMGLGLNYQYATYGSPPEHDKIWMNIPGAPRNEMTYAIELEHQGLAFGYKYLADPGDLVLGTTSMPVHVDDGDDGEVVPYVGYNSARGFHGAVGFDLSTDTPAAGAGYRITYGWLGTDLSVLWQQGELSTGASLFLSFESIF